MPKAERMTGDEPRSQDPYGRSIHDIRISLIQRCNFEGFSCHGEEANPHEAGQYPTTAINDRGII